MEVLHKVCAGLDVHKKSITACVRTVDGGRAVREVRSFGTMTRDILALGDWLAEHGVTHGAMESTGVYWKPIWNLLESRLELMLVNAQHIKAVPGRKTDVRDCEWIAQLLQHGLLRPSFVPAAEQRDLRDLARSRAVLVQERGRVANRIQKVLEDANIKLAAVASDVLGKSGREMLRGLIAGVNDPKVLADEARGRMRAKTQALEAALEGRVREHHRFMLKQELHHVEFLEAQIEALEGRIESLMGPFEADAELLKTIPGVSETVSYGMLAEIGTDMERFKTPAHLASWAGICPGNFESAGKRKSSRMTGGNPWLRRLLVQAAWAASHTKDTYLRALYNRLAARRGKKRAIMAVAHSILVSAWSMLKKRVPYAELGADHFDHLNKDTLKHRLVHRLKRLGFTVTLETQSQPA